jgi:DNA modification methylase
MAIVVVSYLRVADRRCDDGRRCDHVADRKEEVIYTGDALTILKTLPEASAHCCITSPPYWRLRDYGVTGQIGLEKTPEEYVSMLVEVFREVRRVLRDDGTLWLNLGDSYAAQGGGGDQLMRSPTPGLKPKDLIGIPWRVAFAFQSDGWWLRSDIIWAKTNPMPESVSDRPTRSHEYIFLLAKSQKYYYDHEAIKEPSVSDHGSGNGFKRAARLSFADDNGPRGSDTPWQPKSWNSSKFDGQRDLIIHPNVGRKPRTAKVHGNLPGRSDEGAACNAPGQEFRNKRDVWTINSDPFPEAHFATFPPALIRPCVLAGCPSSGTILDPFSGAGTTGLVAKQNGRQYIGIELKPEYVAMSEKRLAQEVLEFC